MVTHQIIKTYRSKKNKVRLIQEANNAPIIQKQFSSFVNKEKEIWVLRNLHKRGLGVPTLIDHKGSILYESYIEGPLFLHVYEELERKEEDGDIAVEGCFTLCEWLYNFHMLSTQFFNQPHIMGDVNLRNYIWSKEGIVGFDFEDCKPGQFQEDLACLLAFLLLYDPVLTPWKEEVNDKLISRINKEWQISKKLLLDQRNEQMKKLRRRRV